METYTIKLTCKELYDLCMIVANHQATANDSQKRNAKHLLNVLVDQEVKQQIEYQEKQ